MFIPRVFVIMGSANETGGRGAVGTNNWGSVVRKGAGGPTVLLMF